MARRTLTSSEQRGWARVTRSVRPLPGVARDGVEGSAAVPDADQTAKPSKQGRRPPSLPQSPLAEPKPVGRSPQPRDRERKVRRGQIDIDAHFDLHGLTQAQAERRLPAFILSRRQVGGRCVLVITGKGRGGEGILRRNFLEWLSSGRAAEHVSGYAPAHARHGGGGAFYVFLRRL